MPKPPLFVLFLGDIVNLPFGESMIGAPLPSNPSAKRLSLSLLIVPTCVSASSSSVKSELPDILAGFL